MDNKERGSHLRSVYPTQDTSSMKAPRVKQEEEADTRIIIKDFFSFLNVFGSTDSKIVRYLEERNVGTKRNCPEQGLTSAKDVTIDLPCHRLYYPINKTCSLIYGSWGYSEETEEIQINMGNRSSAICEQWKLGKMYVLS